MPRPTRHARAAQGDSFGKTILAAAGFGVTLIVGGVIGFAAGRPAKEADKPKAVEVAQNNPAPTPPVVKPPETEKPVVVPTPKPEVKKPEPKKPPEVKKPDPPKKSEPEPKKPEPKKPDPAPSGMAVSFQKDVLPIFKAKCNICHGDTAKVNGDLDTRTLAALVKGGVSGPSVKAGKPDESPVWTSISDGTMPPGNKEKLTAAEAKLVKDWILAGAK